MAIHPAAPPTSSKARDAAIRKASIALLGADAGRIFCNVAVRCWGGAASRIGAKIPRNAALVQFDGGAKPLRMTSVRRDRASRNFLRRSKGNIAKPQ